MSANITLYQKMTKSTEELINVMKKEIGVKGCVPFAIRALDALNELNINTESDAKKAANTFLDQLQTLAQGGILTEDYDKIDFVKRGGVITISARVQALIRAARRKGYIITETVIAVPKDEDIYFEEQFHNGQIVYLVKDQRKNTDREITAERLINGYFKKYLCRLEVLDTNKNVRIMTVTEMSNDEVMRAQASSDNGIFKSEWIAKTNDKGYTSKTKVINDGKNGRPREINFNSIWYKWTSEMIKKTIMRRALKNIKETLPDLKETIYAFESEDVILQEEMPQEVPIIDVEGVEINVDLEHLTAEQKQDVEEMFEIYKQNPQNAAQDAEMINEKYKSGIAIKDIINDHYAEIVNISKSKKLYSLVENIIKGVEYEKVD